MNQLLTFLQIQNMDLINTSCLICHKSLPQMIVLVCDHLICLACAQQIKTIEGHSNIENKYKIICSYCKKSTVTYDVINLRVSMDKSENSILLFQNLQSSQINESSLAEDRVSLKKIDGAITTKQFSHRDLKQMTYSQRFTNLITHRKQTKTPEIPFDRKQNRSKFSQDSYNDKYNAKGKIKQQEYATKCHIHNQGLLFFCQNQKKLLCIECMYKHTRENKIHKVVSVKTSIQLINKQNMQYKEQTKIKLEEIQKCLKVCEDNKQAIQKNFKKYAEFIRQQFKSLINVLKQRQQNMLQYLKSSFIHRQKELVSQINNLTYIKNCLKEYNNFSIEGLNSEIYFFNAYSTMRFVVQKISLNFKLIEKYNNISIQKGSTIQDFKNTVQRYIYFKKIKKSEKGQSKSQQGHAYYKNKVKDETIKEAKKKIQKLQKEQKQQKHHQYLNNYTISLNKKDGQFQRETTARQRKSSGQFYERKVSNKIVTPTTRLNMKRKHSKK